jgi:hypothetical protein
MARRLARVRLRQLPVDESPGGIEFRSALDSAAFSIEVPIWPSYV